MSLPTPPILFIVFRRPENTARVFETIRLARPRQLFIAADGPRQSRPEDAERCRAVRQIVSRVDWPCDVSKRFAETNLGCGRNVSEAIAWFFENVSEGVILEDDVLCSPSFFNYAAVLLERYRDDSRVMSLSGYNPLLHGVGDGDYYASAFHHCWGWATWRRVARLYDRQMANFPEFRDSGLIKSIFRTRLQRRHFMAEFDRCHAGKTENWDQQWFYMILINRGVCLNPCVNLVKNIGFGPDSTFAANSLSYHATRQIGTINAPKAPTFLIPDVDVEEEILRKAYRVSPVRQILNIVLRPFLPKIMPFVWKFAKFTREKKGR